MPKQDHLGIPGALDGPVGQVLVHPQPAAGAPKVIGVHLDEFFMNSGIYSCTPVPHLGDSFG